VISMSLLHKMSTVKQSYPIALNLNDWLFGFTFWLHRHLWKHFHKLFKEVSTKYHNFVHQLWKCRSVDSKMRYYMKRAAYFSNVYHYTKFSYSAQRCIAVVPILPLCTGVTICLYCWLWFLFRTYIKLYCEWKICV
jgi:hypothetical protein